MKNYGRYENIYLVLTTAGNMEEAKKMANILVDERLAACVNIVPNINSVYRWEGIIERAEEVLLLAKTTEEELEETIETMEKTHSYETPEVIAFQSENGLPKYLEWIKDNVGE